MRGLRNALSDEPLTPEVEERLVETLYQARLNSGEGNGSDEENWGKLAETGDFRVIAGRSSDFAEIEAFASYLGTFAGTPKDGWFKLSGGKDKKLTLSLNLASAALPKINGKDIDLRPKMLFDSPFMTSEHGSGIVTIRKGERELVIDITE